MENEFLQDYVGPSSFYQLYESIYYKKPVFLQRLLRSPQRFTSSKGFELSIRSKHITNSFLTIGFVKIHCDHEIHTKFAEKCQILHASQHPVDRSLIQLSFPVGRPNYKTSNPSSLFIVVFHLGKEQEMPSNIIEAILKTPKGRDVPMQYFIAELLPHQTSRKTTSKFASLIQARKDFIPVATNRPFHLKLNVPSKKPSRGSKQGKFAASNSATDEDFEITMRWVAVANPIPLSQSLSKTSSAQDPETKNSQNNSSSALSSTIYYHFLTKNSADKIEVHKYIKCPWCRYPQQKQQQQEQQQQQQEQQPNMSNNCVNHLNQPLSIHASPSQCDAVWTWTNLELAGGVHYAIPTNPNIKKNLKRKLELSESEASNNSSDVDCVQFSSSVIWSESIRVRIQGLLIHLTTFHPHFQYQYCCDRLLNIHIFVSRIHSPQSPFLSSSDLLNNSTSIPSTVPKRASPISVSSSSNSSSKSVSIKSNIPQQQQQQQREQKTFLFFGKSWRNLFTDDFPILILKSIDCDCQSSSSSSLLLTSSSFFSSSMSTSSSSASPFPSVEISSNSINQQCDVQFPAINDLTNINLLLPEELKSTIPFTSLENENSNVTEIQVTPSTISRQYFHSNGRTIETIEGEYDSDHDINTSWEHIHSYDLIEEFQDVCYLEKKFMIIWNTFINSFPIYSDRYMGAGLEVFAKRFGPYLIKNGLRQIFLLHLMALWDFSLITFPMILNCVKLVDQCHEKYLFSLGSSSSLTASSSSSTPTSSSSLSTSLSKHFPQSTALSSTTLSSSSSKPLPLPPPQSQPLPPPQSLPPPHSQPASFSSSSSSSSNNKTISIQSEVKSNSNNNNNSNNIKNKKIKNDGSCNSNVENKNKRIPIKEKK